MFMCAMFMNVHPHKRWIICVWSDNDDNFLMFRALIQWFDLECLTNILADGQLPVCVSVCVLGGSLSLLPAA